MKKKSQGIQEFLAPRKFAMAGVSRNPKKFGFMAYKDLKNRGFMVYPLNPEADTIDGDRCFRSVSELPGEVSHLVTMVPKDQTKGIVEEAIAHGIKSIWIQQMSDTPEAIELARQHQVHLVTKNCILLHTKPVKGFHGFHRNMLRLFGMLPS
jgi:predicted CoA-binding protein